MVYTNSIIRFPVQGQNLWRPTSAGRFPVNPRWKGSQQVSLHIRTRRYDLLHHLNVGNRDQNWQIAGCMEDGRKLGIASVRSSVYTTQAKRRLSARSVSEVIFHAQAKVDRGREYDT